MKALPATPTEKVPGYVGAAGFTFQVTLMLWEEMAPGGLPEVGRQGAERPKPTGHWGDGFQRGLKPT